jgi:hypothetical protein
VSGKPEKDLNFCPAESFDTIEQAREFAALLALKHLTPTLPLERKMPEPFAAVWISLRGKEPQLTDNSRYTSQAARNQVEELARQRDNRKEMKEVNIYKHLASVFMSEVNRQYVEDIIKALKGSMGSSEPAVPAWAEHMLVGATEPEADPSLDELCQKLTDLGFFAQDARQAARQVGGDASKGLGLAMDWLFLNLPEHRLPQSMSKNGGLEVVTNQKSDGVQSFLGIGRMGFPAHVCIRASEQAQKVGGERWAEAALLQMFRDLNAPRMAGVPTPLVDAETRAGQIEDEVMALEAIFDTDFCKLGANSWSVALGGLGTLVVLVPKDCAYPAELPVWVLRGDKFSAQQKLYLVRSLARFCLDDALLGEPLTFNVVEQLKEQWEQMLASSAEFAVPESWKGVGGHLSSQQQKILLDTQSQASSSSNSHASSTLNSDAPARTGVGRGGAKGGARGGTRGGANRQAPATRKDVNMDHTLLATHRTKETSDKTFQDMMRRRAVLPAWKSRKELLKLIDDSQVVVVSGQTGCGKSTQIPQFVLDHFIQASKGSECNIICTQPRRISAIGLAERVAEERAEKVGDTVGYRIRMEVKGGQNTRLFYVTTGILLRQLSSDVALKGVSHVIIDEVHERSLDIDFILIVLRHTLRRRPDLKVVLMSATLDADLFADYFGGAPVVSIPGRTFPVTQFFLEDVLERMGPGVMSKRGHHKGVSAQDKEKAIAATRQQLEGEYSDQTIETLVALDGARIDFDLCTALVWHIIETMPPGGILIFMPGVAEITKLCTFIERAAADRGLDESALWLVPLHGALATAKQQRVFARAPKGVTKIVVSTNIAETSITVDDVLYVVDAGKVQI